MTQSLQAGREPRVADDMVSRPGSAVSLLRTVVGLYLREAGGWMPTDAFLALLGALGVPVPQAPTVLSRDKARALLQAQARDGVPGFALAPGAADSSCLPVGQVSASTSAAIARVPSPSLASC